jgi:fatty acid desaturase
MTDEPKQPLQQPARKVAAIMSYLAGACFFLIAAIKPNLAPWFLLAGGLNLMAGTVMLMSVRKHTAQHAAAADRPQAGDRV